MAVNAFVGAMVGLERAILPLLGEQTFGVTSRLAILGFVAAFGATKAVANLAAGALADRWTRKRVLMAGWVVGLFVPIVIIAAPSWEWVVFANALLGVQQGLCWSMTVAMKVDLAGPARRGLALGINESAGYAAVALSALAGAAIAEATALRPEPFLLGAVIAALGGLLSLTVTDTGSHVRLESARRQTGPSTDSFVDTVAQVSWKDRSLFSASQAGFANNLNDGVAWGLLPSFFATGGLSVGDIGLLAAIYPGTWAIAQPLTGALSDRVGRRPLIVSGMVLQAMALAALVLFRGLAPWVTGMVVLGVGTALVYPTLLAVIADGVSVERRATAIGVYRFWRDAGYVCGAVLAGMVGDTLGTSWAIAAIAALTFVSGVVAARYLSTTRRTRRAIGP